MLNSFKESWNNISFTHFQIETNSKLQRSPILDHKPQRHSQIDHRQEGDWIWWFTYRHQCCSSFQVEVVKLFTTHSTHLCAISWKTKPSGFCVGIKVESDRNKSHGTQFCSKNHGFFISLNEIFLIVDYYTVCFLFVCVWHRFDKSVCFYGCICVCGGWASFLHFHFIIKNISD